MGPRLGTLFRELIARRDRKSAELWEDGLWWFDFPGTPVLGNLNSKKWEGLLSGFPPPSASPRGISLVTSGNLTRAFIAASPNPYPPNKLSKTAGLAADSMSYLRGLAF